MMRHELFEVGSYDYSDLDERLTKPVEWTEEDLKLIAENYRGGIPLTEEHDRIYIGIGNDISYEKGKLITGLDNFKGKDGYYCFHAGTKATPEGIVTNGGRVLGITAKGDTLAEARAKAYEATEWVSFENKYMRHDIGKAIDEA